MQVRFDPVGIQCKTMKTMDRQARLAMMPDYEMYCVVTAPRGRRGGHKALAAAGQRARACRCSAGAGPPGAGRGSAVRRPGREPQICPRPAGPKVSISLVSVCYSSDPNSLISPRKGGLNCCTCSLILFCCNRCVDKSANSTK